MKLKLPTFHVSNKSREYFRLPKFIYSGNKAFTSAHIRQPILNAYPLPFLLCAGGQSGDGLLLAFEAVGGCA